MPQKKHTIAFRTLGCKLNQCETAQMEKLARDAGFMSVSWHGHADVRVLNSCTVTAKTDRECRHEARRAKRNDPQSFLMMVGCYAQASPEAAAAVEGVDLVLGNPDKLNLGMYLSRAFVEKPVRATAVGEPPIIVTPYPKTRIFPALPIHHFGGYTRAFLEVQTGCDAHCSYCIIPKTRGPSCSMRLEEAVEQVRILKDAGYREVVLTGIHLGMWGRDTGEGTLADLLAALTALPDGPRIRVSSTEPMEIDERVLAVMKAAGTRVSPHFHVPLQSGSNAVLRRMNRLYTAEAYVKQVESIREAFPEAAIGADVIVGFPGETDSDFEESLYVVQTGPLTYVHVFAYSDRPGTVASALPDKVPPETIAERSKILRAAGSEKRRRFMNRFAGRYMEALVLARRDTAGRLEGLTGNYMQVLFEGSDALMNTHVEVLLERLDGDDIWHGRVMSPRAAEISSGSYGGR
ncbi:MAG: tRNA (N(6)-L-threonylcarbamoyladenosine(37)-C(2))-methylthiotransferase MtaB [Actinobacteria bacterium]|nr:tRNA (N(6)-L-threonylcarbamoyladenosine(37)-C(2))-methylthiotransferase MtaB [Actinomycetota bacterium]